MKLTDRYLGGNDPFEGDRTLVLRSLPIGAQVTKAAVTLAPALPTGRTQPEEAFNYTITFLNGQGDLGATKIAGAFVEVDFHARRTLAKVAGSGGNATLQVDLGGAFVGVADDGTLAGGKPAWPVTLSNTDAALPGLTVSKFRLSRASGNSSDLNVTRALVRSAPTNLNVRVGQMPPFWVRLGELGAVDTSPDFAAILNAYLLEAPVENGFYAILFVIHSDTLARLDIELAIDFVVEQPILPPHLSEVVLPYRYSTLPGADEAVTTALLARDAIPIQAGALVRGEFAPSRIARGPIGEGPATISVVVAPECSLAQPLLTDLEIALTGLDIPLANTAPGLAGMHVALQGDNDGKPSGEILTSADVRIDKPLPGQSSWGSATLPAPFRVLPGVRYWLVLQSRVGQAYWSATPAVPGMPALQCSRDGGLSWRAASAPDTPAPLAALFRLRDTPERFSVPVRLQIGKGPEAVLRRLDEFAPLARVEFRFDFAARLAEYLGQAAAAAPCGRGELLTNSDFSQPPDDDASLRLFGFDSQRVADSSSPAVLEGLVNLDRGVDLSVQRFILLSIANEAEPDGTESPKVMPQRIDCAGVDPAKTRPVEIVAAINRAMGAEIASYDRALIITAPTQPTGGETSVVELHGWCRPQVPAGWQGVAGRVVRVRRDERLLAVLVAPPTLLNCLGQAQTTLALLDPAELAQIVTVSGGCAYLLRVRYWVRSIHDEGAPPAPGRWQIRWLASGGRVLGDEGALLSNDPQQEIGPLLHEARLVAPQGALAAELRFTQQPTGLLILEDVSFAPTLEAVHNPLFRFWEPSTAQGQPDLPLSWSVWSGWVDRQPQGALLRGAGPDDGLLPTDTVLVQRIAVQAGVRYELRARAWPRLPLPGDPMVLPIEQRARLELRWLGGAAVAAPAVVPLDGRDFPTHAWAEVAPAGAIQAEIRLIQPRALGDLRVESVSLIQVDRVPVPLIFLAESPGEMTVSKLRVTYDLPAPPPEPGFSTLRQAAARRAILAHQEVAAPPRRARLADSQVEVVAGVGEQIRTLLAGLPAPITTIAELAALDLESDIAGITRERRLELKATAEMIIDLDIAAAPFAALAGESLETLLFLPLDELAQRAGQSTAQAEQFQRKLRALRRLIKNDAFRGMHLHDLISPAG